MVYVFPEPVTPRRTCDLSPLIIPEDNFRMAVGWSPVGLNGATILKDIIAILQNFLNPEDVVEVEEEVEAKTTPNDLPWKDEEEAPKKAPKKESNYTLKTAPKVSKADKFDALFEEEN